MFWFIFLLVVILGTNYLSNHLGEWQIKKELEEEEKINRYTRNYKRRLDEQQEEIEELKAKLDKLESSDDK